MMLDIRLPMGYLFMLLGGLLVTYGLFMGVPTAGATAAFNINLWWGAVMLAFGSAMWWLAKRAAAKERGQ